MNEVNTIDGNNDFKKPTTNILYLFVKINYNQKFFIVSQVNFLCNNYCLEKIILYRYTMIIL